MIKQPKKKVNKAEEFAKEYGKLCEKYGYKVIVSPAWRFSNETKDYRMVLQTSVGPQSKT